MTRPAGGDMALAPLGLLLRGASRAPTSKSVRQGTLACPEIRHRTRRSLQRLDVAQQYDVPLDRDRSRPAQPRQHPVDMDRRHSEVVADILLRKRQPE